MFSTSDLFENILKANPCLHSIAMHYEPNSAHSISFYLFNHFYSEPSMCPVLSKGLEKQSKKQPDMFEFKKLTL